MYIRQSQHNTNDHYVAIWLRRLAITGLAYLLLDGLTRLMLPLILAYGI